MEGAPPSTCRRLRKVLCATVCTAAPTRRLRVLAVLGVAAAVAGIVPLVTALTSGRTGPDLMVAATSPGPPATAPAARTPRPPALVGTPTPTGGPSPTADPAVTRVIDLTNARRVQAGCSALTADARLAAAQGHSADMAAKGYFSHTSRDGRTPWDRIGATGYRFTSAAENIARSAHRR